MKNYLNFFIIFSLFLFASCKKEKQGCTDTAAKNFDLFAKEDDGSCIYPVKLFQAKVSNSLVVCDSAISANSVCQVWAGKKGGTGFSIVLNATGVGTYQFLSAYNGVMCEAFYTKDFDFNNSYHSRNGSVTITSYTEKNVKGNFNFFAVNSSTTDSVQISEGSFDIDVGS